MNNSFKNNNSNIAIHLHHLLSTNHRPQTSTLRDFSRRMVDMITFVGLPCSSSTSSQKLGIAKLKKRVCGMVGAVGGWVIMGHASVTLNCVTQQWDMGRMRGTSVSRVIGKSLHTSNTLTFCRPNNRTPHLLASRTI